jgi:hypothetical protein
MVAPQAAIPQLWYKSSRARLTRLDTAHDTVKNMQPGLMTGQLELCITTFTGMVAGTSCVPSFPLRRIG